MWEQKPFELTQEQYYKLLLINEVTKGTLILYGYNKFSLTKKIEPIPVECISNECASIRNPEYDTIYSKLDEVLYTNISIKIDNLNQIIEYFKF